VQRGLRALGVVHDRALGDLQAQAMRGRVVLVQQHVELLGQLHVEQIARGQVDRHARDADRGQRRLMAHHLFEHPQRDLADEAGLLGERNELHRRHQSARRMLPAHQRFGAAQAAAADLHLGLQEQAQLTAFHRLPQLGQQRQRLAARVVERGLVQLRAGGAALGGVHRDLGARQQRLAGSVGNAHFNRRGVRVSCESECEGCGAQRGGDRTMHGRRKGMCPIRQGPGQSTAARAVP
jgi:hypothetical protein